MRVESMALAELISDTLLLKRPHSVSRWKIFSRAWFTRRWVLQEVAFARVPVVRCGHHEAPWEQFYQGAAEYMRHHATGKLEHAV